MVLNEIDMQRLAFIRYMYTMGIEQSRQSEPLSATSILTFHDSVELFLQLASEKLDKGKKDIDFLAYWDILSPKMHGEGLTQKESMRRLNASRVALKHHGTLPAKLDIESHRAAVTNFFEDNTPLIFGLAFSEISLVNLVVNLAARENLTSSIDSLNIGDNENSIKHAAIAYYQVIGDSSSKSFGPIYAQNSASSFDYSNFGRTSFGSGNFQVPEVIHQFAYDVKSSFSFIENFITIIALGIDCKKYSMFLTMTPSVWQTQDGKYHTSPIYNKSAIKENAQFCIDFVIECALRIQS